MPRGLSRFLAILGFALPALCQAASPAEILNEASVQYIPTGSPGPLTVFSDTVHAAIDYTPNFALMGTQQLKTPVGSTVVLPHVLMNQGAHPLLFQLSAQADTASQFTPSAIHVFSDLNGNGQIDAGEPEIMATDAIPVAGSEQIALLVRIAVPGNAQANQWASVQLTAHEVGSGQRQMKSDTVIAESAPAVLGLFIEKTVTTSEIEVGDTVNFTVRVKNVVASPISGVEILDTLPVGFVYVPGTLRVNGDRTGNPVVSSGSFLVAIGTLAPGDTASITYTARATAAAIASDGMSRAQAVALGFTSNLAEARVRVRPGVLDAKGVLVGRVFVDKNNNGLLDAGEPGIPGVRIFLEDGTSATTDAEGKYSFYGLAPRTHVAKVDFTSLPHGAALAVTSNAQAKDAGTQFADLKNYELHKTNFAIASGSPEIFSEIEARRRSLRRPGAEIARGLAGRLTADGLPAPVADPKSLPSSGQIKVTGDEIFPAATERPALIQPVAAPDKTVTAADNFDALAGVTDGQFSIVNLKEGQVLPIAQSDIWVKGKPGAHFQLAVNGAVIGESQVGTRATLPDRGVEAWNFVGVNLAPGDNRIRASLVDAFGNVRDTATLHVVAPGALAWIKVKVPDDAVADGTTPVSIEVELLDAQGTPITTRTPLTLDASKGQWQVEDLDPATPGTQVFIEGGHQTFLLVPPADPGEGAITVSSGAVKGQSDITFHPNLRPMLAVGVVEGSLHFGSRGKGAIFPAGAADAFEQELRLMSATSGNGRLGGGARTAFFLKGKIKGDYLLTAAYDSDKDTSGRLFRDIQPDEFYPVYGDASDRNYDAQSTGRLYVRIDRNRSYALFGDFTTTALASSGSDTAQSLGGYQRSLTGAREHYETDRVTSNIWASQDSTRQVIVELAGNGTSGPFDFVASGTVANSERVEILTRDRNQPSRILDTHPLARFEDYEFEPFTGQLLLRAPVPSVDANLNPMSIRITAEVDQGGGKFWVYGGDSHVRLSPQITLGGGLARDENPQDHYQLSSSDVTVKLSENTRVIAEVAHSEAQVEGNGWAERIDFKHKDDRTQIHAYLGKTDVAFSNPGALLLPGHIEGGLEFNYKLTASTSLIAQGIVSHVLATQAVRQGVRVEVEHSFGVWRVALGVRHSDNTAGENDPTDTVNSVHSRVTVPVPIVKGAFVFGEYERDVRSGRQMAATGFDYAFPAGGRAYGRHEFITSLDGPYDLSDTQRKHTTVLGLEHAFMKDGQFFNEYRADNELTTRDAEAAMGLRNLWKIADGIRANTSFERITPLSGTVPDESTAITGALDYAVDPRWRANARLEYRTSTATDSLLNTLGYARLLDTDWTFLGKTIFLVTDSKGANSGETVQSRVQAGLAWRPAQLDRWNALGKYEAKYETDSHATAQFERRLTQIISADVNYQPDAHWIVSGHYAGKWVRETGATGKGDTVAHLVGERIDYTINHRWDIALNANTLFDGDLRQNRFAIGPEAGVVLGKNLTLGVGYNVTGFRDDDFAADGSTARGFFVRVRFKFDEDLLPGHADPAR